jgi:hypothetical protein
MPFTILTLVLLGVVSPVDHPSSFARACSYPILAQPARPADLARTLPRDPSGIDQEDNPTSADALIDDDDDATSASRRHEAIGTCECPHPCRSVLISPHSREYVRGSRPLIYTLCTLLI